MNAHWFKLIVIHYLTEWGKPALKALIIEDKIVGLWRNSDKIHYNCQSSPASPLPLVCEAAGSVYCLVKPTVESIQLPWSCHVESSKQISSLHFPLLWHLKTRLIGCKTSSLSKKSNKVLFPNLNHGGYNSFCQSRWAVLCS